MRAIQITEFGGPEVLVPRQLPEPTPGRGEVLLAVRAAGVNYADTHQTEDSYLAPTSLPYVPGAEVVGLTPQGRRVVSFVGGGGYAERVAAPGSGVFEVPDGVTDGEALALTLQGATAWHLLRTSAHLEPGETVVVLAAAGGVGSLAVQLARRWGAGRVIGTASTPEKRALAERLGADVVVDSGTDDLGAALREANGGRRVDVVLEMVGGPTFDSCLAAIAPFGRLVTYGMAGRRTARPVEPQQLLATSAAVIGFWLAHCAQREGMLATPVGELLDLAAAGEIEAVVGGTYPLDDARRAHEDLLGRGTTGKLVLEVGDPEDHT